METKIRFICLLILFISCKENQSTERKNESPIEAISNNTEESKTAVIYTSKDSLDLDLENEYVNYMVNFDYENWHGMSESLRYDDNMFPKFYDNPSEYLDEAKAIINNNKISFDNKDIVAYSMTGLPLEKRIEMLSYMFDCFKVNKVNYHNLFVIIGGDLSSNRLIYANYKNKKLRKILQKIVDDSLSPENLKNYASKILSGQRLKDYLERKQTDEQIIEEYNR